MVNEGGRRIAASAVSRVHGSRRNFVGSEETEGEGEVVRDEAPDSEGDVHDDEEDIRREWSFVLCFCMTCQFSNVRETEILTGLRWLYGRFS